MEYATARDYSCRTGISKLSYMEKGMLAYSLADVEWMEYRVVSPEDHLNRVAEIGAISSSILLLVNISF